MKRLLCVIAAVFLGGIGLCLADGPDDTYVSIYSLIQEGDQMSASGQNGVARERYLQAQKELLKLQSSHPGWNEGVIRFRINYVTQKLGGTEGAAALPLEKAKAKAPVTDEKEARIQALTAEIQRLNGDRAVLEAKLKEALTAQPAAADPRELARAEEKIRGLEKEKELLRVSLEQEAGKGAKAGDAGALEKLRENLAQANRKMAEQADSVTALTREKEILEARVKTLSAEAETARKQPGAAAAPAADAAQAAANARMIASLQENLKKVQADKEALEKSSKEMEKQIATLSAAKAPKADAGLEERLQKVTQERDELQKKLTAASKSTRRKSGSKEEDQLQNQLAMTKARLEALEARKVPYTPEELALFKQPKLEPAKPATVEVKPAVKPTRKELPAGVAPLLADAERNFAARRYNEAETKYQEALKLDSKNVVMLSNLAATQLEQNRFAEAEATLKRALETEAEDAHSLSLMGILKFRTEKYDDALDFLSRASQADGKNPETQNYLGITLSQKGQRPAAEAALRKAVQLAPNYGGAHHNLAVIYATQQPPFAELAKYHYQKALAAGHPQNAELERLIEKAQK